MLPQYSGGLGVLAGDHLKAASDLGVPLVGIGLFYGAGYFRQSLATSGLQQEDYPALNPACCRWRSRPADGRHPGLRRGAGLTVHAQVWRVEVGRVSLFLLDANLATTPRRRAS